MNNYFDALEKAKTNVALNIGNQVGFDETADVLEKGKRATMGEVRVWNGVKYQKTPGGWIPVKGEGKGTKTEPEKKEEGELSSEESKVPNIEEKVASVKEQEAYMDRVLEEQISSMGEISDPVQQANKFFEIQENLAKQTKKMGDDFMSYLMQTGQKSSYLREMMLNSMKRLERLRSARKEQQSKQK